MPLLIAMTWVTLTMVSGNRKVGAIPVSTTDKDSCPKECGAAKDCYAKFGKLSMHWSKVGEGMRGFIWSMFCKAVKRLPKFQPWRHNQAGDMPKDEQLPDDSCDRMDRDMAIELAKAAKHTRGWTYTHYVPTDEHNASVIRDVNEMHNGKQGLVINLSADTLAQADEYSDLGIAPVVVTLPLGTPHRGNRTPAGRQIVVCPAQTQDDMTCARCQLWAVRDRKSVVGFIAHGTAKKRMSRTLNEANAA